MAYEILNRRSDSAQGAFRKVAAESEACARAITRQLQQRMAAQDSEAAECIRMVRKLGAPVDSLQVRAQGAGLVRAREAGAQVLDQPWAKASASVLFASLFLGLPSCGAACAARSQPEVPACLLTGCRAACSARPWVQDEFLGCMDKRMQAVLSEAAAVAPHVAGPGALPAGAREQTRRLLLSKQTVCSLGCGWQCKLQVASHWTSPGLAPSPPPGSRLSLTGPWASARPAAQPRSQPRRARLRRPAGGGPG